MRRLLISALLTSFACSSAMADDNKLIGQLGQNATETGERSNASLDQIGKRVVETRGLMDQIDPDAAPASLAARMQDDNVDMMGRTSRENCDIGQDQQAMINYLRIEGRVFEDNCQLLDWLEGRDGDDPTDRELFETAFGTEAQRLQQLEQNRIEQEQLEAAAQARMMQAITAPPGDG